MNTDELVDKFIIQLWFFYLTQSLTLLLLNLLTSLYNKCLQFLVLLDLLRKIKLSQQVYHLLKIQQYPTHPITTIPTNYTKHQIYSPRFILQLKIKRTGSINISIYLNCCAQVQFNIFLFLFYSKSTRMSQVRYTTNEHVYGAEQGYTVANPLLANGTGQYTTTYQNVYPVGQQEVTYTNYAASNQPGYSYVVGAGNVGSTVRNTTVEHSIAAPPKITFGHPSGGYANTSFYQSYVPPQQATTTTTYVTNPQTIVSNPQTTIVSNPQETVYVVADPQTSTKVVRETAAQGQIVKANPTVSTTSTYSAKNTNDDFLCSKCCWILTALIALALLTLALLYGLGVFGGAGTPSVSGPTVAANLPQVNGGKVAATAPSVNGPNLSLNGPHVTAPSVNLNGPTLTAPNVDINAPKVNLPNVDINGPHITAPSVNLPSGSISPSSVNLNGGVIGTTGVSSLPAGQIAPTIGPTSSYVPSTNNQVQVQPASISPQSVEPVSVAPVTYTPTNTVYSQPTVSTRTVSVQPVTTQPTYNPQPTSIQPTSVQPTSFQPTSFQPTTTIQPTSVQPTTIQPTTIQPTTIQPTSYQPASTSSQKYDPYYDESYNRKYIPAYPVQ